MVLCGIEPVDKRGRRHTGMGLCVKGSRSGVGEVARGLSEEPEPELVPVRLIRGNHEMDVDGMMAIWWLEGLMRRIYLIFALETLRRWRAR